MKKLHFALSFLLTCGLAALSQERKNEPEPPRTYREVNPPTSPVSLVTYPNGYDVTNKSEKKIVQYRLGCVVEKPKTIKILTVLPPEEASIKPGWQIGSGVMDGIEPAILECVHKRDVKIAVVEVHFEDGAKWVLK